KAPGAPTPVRPCSVLRPDAPTRRTCTRAPPRRPTPCSTSTTATSIDSCNMAEEDVQQEVSNWIDGYRLPDGSLRNISDEEDGAGAGADGDAEKKDAIDVEEEEG
ncbi:unnamed protein product, partial [Urochloa humidicola]